MKDRFAELVEKWIEGDEKASAELFSSVHKELYVLARSNISRFDPENKRELQPEALVNEAYIQLIEGPPHLQNRSQFLAIVARIMRNILINYARNNLVAKREAQPYSWRTSVQETGDEKSQTELVALHEALERLEKVDARKAKVIELRFFLGLTISETAQLMAVAPTTVARDFSLGKAWLTRELSGGSASIGASPIFVETSPIFVQSPSIFDKPDPLSKGLTDEEFFDLCQRHKESRIERTKEGELIIMPPTGGEAGIRNAKLIARFVTWAEQDGSGQGFDSSTGFTLPNRAIRSPDLSWLRNDRWNALSHEQKEKFPPLCPDFIVEIRSPSDSLLTLQEKMEEYISNGAQLGWLIDPIERRVHKYKAGSAPEVFDNPKTVSGDPLLPGFVLNVRELWDT
jgi:RNA polymerase sigma factor (TIGR02999 family)